MTFKEQYEQALALLQDPDLSSNLWDESLVKAVLNQGNDETARRLPPEEVRVLQKAKSVDVSLGVAEYPIESAPFGLTDFRSESAVWLTDGTVLRLCHPVTKEVFDTDNPYYKGTRYQPAYCIAERSDAAGERAIYVSPAPAADKSDGLRLVYIAQVASLSADSDVSELPPRFHKLPVWFAVAMLLAKERDADAARYWTMWRDILIAENAKYGRSIEVAERPGR